MNINMALKIPFFHYTHIDNLFEIIRAGEIRCRKKLEETGASFRDVSIDPEQKARTELSLTNYLPLFAGYYKLLRSYDLNGYLQMNYDSPKLQNVRFYGSLHKTIRIEHPDDYKKITILMIKPEKISQLADSGKVKLFYDLAIKTGTDEYDATNYKQLLDNICKCIVVNERNQNIISCEVDLNIEYDSLIFPDDVEAIILNDEKSMQELNDLILRIKGTSEMRTIKMFVDPLPD